MTRRFRLPWRRRADAPGALACREVVELVTDYVEGTMPAPDRARFEAHLALCEGCATYVAQLRATIVLVGSVTPDALSPEARSELTAAFHDWRAGAG